MLSEAPDKKGLCCLVSSLINVHRIFKRLAKALIRLRGSFAGAHTTLLEISCHGSNILLCISSLLLNHFKSEKIHSKAAPCIEENEDLE